MATPSTACLTRSTYRSSVEVGAEVLAALDGVAASTGSACHSGRIELSPVLKAMGVAPEVGMGAVRFSLGRSTTKAEIDTVIAMIRDRVADLGC